MKSAFQHPQWTRRDFLRTASAATLAALAAGSPRRLAAAEEEKITSTADTDYTAVYTFRIVGITSGPTPVSSAGYISSGQQTKHTDDSSLAVLPPIQPTVNALGYTLDRLTVRWSGAPPG